MEWNDIKDCKPEGDSICYVCNARSGGGCFRAIYHSRYDAFVLDEPMLRNHPALDVTHWILLPSPMLYQD